MKIKKGDTVLVIAGKNRGTTSKVLRAFPRQSLVLVEGVNIKKRHMRPRKQGKKGEIVEIPSPVHVSNVMIVDPKSGKRSRIGIKRVDGRATRITKKSGSELA